MSQGSLFDGEHLARSGDRSTSKDAAASLDLSKVDDAIFAVMQALDSGAEERIATYDEMALWCTRQHGKRVEHWRRKLRTACEEHGLLEFVTDDDGDPVTHVNESGRRAQCLQVTGVGRMELARR